MTKVGATCDAKQYALGDFHVIFSHEPDYFLADGEMVLHAPPRNGHRWLPTAGGSPNLQSDRVSRHSKRWIATEL